MPFFVYFIGPAGSGKTTLVDALADWLRNASLEAEIGENNSVACVNLDPGVKWTPYTPDVDVRDYVDYDQVMDKYQLGPNGALVASTDMIINFIDEIKQEILDTRADYVFVDTPGQIELFSFRAAGPRICRELGGEKQVICFLFEPVLVQEPSGFISTVLLSSAVEYRFFFPHLNVLSKSDLLPDEKVEEILEWSRDHFALGDAIDSRTRGIEREKSLKMARVFKELGTISDLIPVSSRQQQGLDTLYGELQRNLAGGEDFESEE